MEATDQSSLFELSIDHESYAHLGETARWAKFLAIVGFVTCGVIAIMSFFIGSLLAASVFSAYGNTGASAVGGALFTGIYLIFAVIYFFPCLFLYQFSIRMKAALKSNDQVKLNQSLKSQKTLFKYMGIMTIVILSFYALGLLAVGLSAMFATR